MTCRILVLFTLAACGGGRGSPPPVGGPLAVDVAALGPSDVFEVRVFNEPDLSGSYRVGHDGSIDFPMVGRVAVEGKNAAELATELQEKLKAFVKSPQVSIFVKEMTSKKIYVFGQVQKPGTFPFEQNMNIIQAVTLAGGFAQLADKDQAFVTRIVDGKEQRLKISIKDIGEGTASNFQLEPGDIVFVPETLF